MPIYQICIVTMTKKLYKHISRIIMTKLAINGRHTRRISNEKHASNINICRSVESVPHGVIWQNEAIGVFPADEVCTGMKLVPV